MFATDDTPSGQQECARLKRYIEALKKAHRKELDGLLAQLRRQARQIAELRMNAGQGSSSEVSRLTTRRATLKVEDIVPLVPPRLATPQPNVSRETETS